ncbi:recombinase family protein [Streptomyces sp. NPDC001796]|uniref:recombinase family protein n=1 Tax=Streptomyces sp. NPDC001796 TaxID=3364609 RepID=UPI003682C5D0
MRAILLNPRYTGHEVWNKQRKEERLLDVDDVTLGHRTHMTHNPPDEWIHSNEPAHEAIISPDLFDAARTVRIQRARNQGQQERVGKRGARLYALRGRVRCSLCGRKMQPATIGSRVYYRCEFKEEEAALYPDLTHPRTVYLREDTVCQAPDRWIARAFAPDRLSATIEALTHASVAASTAEPQTPEQAQARQAIKDCERRLARYQAALDAGADPAVVTQWINEASGTRTRRRRSSTRTPPSPGRSNPHSTRNRSGRSLKVLEILQSASRSPPSRRKVRSTRSWASLSATNTQQGPRRLGRGPRLRIVIRSVRGGS